jgi:hypothetical protein
MDGVMLAQPATNGVSAASAAAAFTRGPTNASARGKVAKEFSAPTLWVCGLPAPSPPPAAKTATDEPEQQQ